MRGRKEDCPAFTECPETVSIIEFSLCVSVPGLKESFKTTSVRNVGEAPGRSSKGGRYRDARMMPNAGVI